MLVGVGCQPNGGEDTTSPAEISVSPAETAISLEGDTKTFTITSNASWVATCEAEGVTCTPEMGKGNGSVTVTVPATTSPRAVVVTFTASKQAVTEGVSFTDSKSVTATIYQNAAGEVVEGGIATIKDAGNHNVEGAWIVAKNAKGIVITDNSGAYIMVFLNKESELSVGQVVNVSGEVELSDKSGLLQFKSTTTVTATGDTIAVSHGTPKDITTYAALDSYANNKTYVYAEMKGQLNVSGTYYNLYVDGKSEYNDYKGSIAYPSSAIASELTALNGANIVVRGYMVGVTGTVYANIVALEVEVDSSNPVLKAENISGVPAAGVTNATHDITVAAIENVTATCDGTIVTFAEVNGNVLTYSVSANEGAAREGEIVLSAEGVESVTIKVAQKAAPSGDAGEEKTVSIVFNTLGLGNAENVADRVFNVDENVSLVFSKGGASNAPAYYDASQGIRMYQNGAVLDVTANGKTITSIDFVFDYNMWYFAADSGTLSAEASTRTWTGEADAIKFTSTGTDKNHRCYIKSMTITYR